MLWQWGGTGDQLPELCSGSVWQDSEQDFALPSLFFFSSLSISIFPGCVLFCVSPLKLSSHWCVFHNRSIQLLGMALGLQVTPNSVSGSRARNGGTLDLQNSWHLGESPHMPSTWGSGASCHESMDLGCRHLVCGRGGPASKLPEFSSPSGGNLRI